MKLSELLNHDDIVIQCHDFPDADTLAAGYGVYLYVTAHGKKPSLVYSGRQKITKPNLLHMVSQLDIPVTYTEHLDKPPEALVTVDCCYGEGNVTRFEADNIYVIDHHRVSGSAKYRSEIHSNYSSCSTVVNRMLKEESFRPNDNRKLATALYYGLFTDSNGMDEVSHPADKDLRDLTDFDEATVTILKNSNLSLEEMKIAGDALKHYKYDNEYRFALVEAMPCDPNILGFISDLLLQTDTVDTCVAFCRRSTGVKISVRSCVTDIKADEMARFIVGSEGSGGGHARKAGGYIGRLDEDSAVKETICRRIREYHSSYEIIYAESYKAILSGMKKYVKKPLVVGYVKSSDVLEAGTEMCIRTLEADLNVCAADDLYIMIGVRGEVYPIRQEKFERSYVPTDKHFDVCAEYTPTVIVNRAFSSIDLMPYAMPCMARGESFIYASVLDKTVKVYTTWDKNNYMLGKAGDYLAVRSDDLHDVYIIEKGIFADTYESCPT